MLIDIYLSYRRVRSCQVPSIRLPTDNCDHMSPHDEKMFKKCFKIMKTLNTKLVTK